jgi:hypothetical protein
MNDKEYDILDELYFTITFENLESKLELSEADLKGALLELIGKGWVKCLDKQADEEIYDLKNFEEEFKNYNYLATKAGLLAHNSR